LSLDPERLFAARHAAAMDYLLESVTLLEESADLEGE
jgi:hypothetical protein